MTPGQHTNDNERGRCLMDVVAEAEGVPVDVCKARFLVMGWLNVEMPPSKTCWGLSEVFGADLPNIAAQCRRGDGVDKIIRVAGRHHQRTGAGK